MITARCFCTPDSPEGEISDLDDDGSWDCVKILEGVMGNAVPEGVRKWQLYRSASRTVFIKSQTVSSLHACIHVRGVKEKRTVGQIRLGRRQIVTELALIYHDIGKCLRIAPVEEIKTAGVDQVVAECWRHRRAGHDAWR